MIIASRRGKGGSIIDVKESVVVVEKNNMRSLKKLLEKKFCKRHYRFKEMIFCKEYQRGWFLTGTRTAAYRNVFMRAKVFVYVYRLNNSFYYYLKWFHETK